MSGTMTNNGLNCLLERAYYSASTKTAPTYGIIGAGTTTPTISDTNLSKPLPSSATTINACDAVGAWSQGGDGGAPVQNTTSGEHKEGTACLNLPTTHSTGSSTWSLTIAGTDLSSQYIYVWYYISDASALLTDAADTVRLTLGTGGFVNVNYYDTDYDNITDGWNLLVFKCSSYSSQGGSGATLSNVDRIRITVKNSASCTTNNQRMDYWHYASETVQRVSLTSGYPQFNTGAKTVTTRAAFESNLYNTGAYVVSETGLRNADNSWVLFSRDTLTQTINKTSKVRIVMTWVETISQ